MRSIEIGSLPSKKPVRRLQDIVKNGRLALHYTAGLDEAAFEEDPLVYAAVERFLSRISEAAVKLGDLAPELAPGQPWQRIRAIGNPLRHDYDEIDEERVWKIVQDDLPSLVTACEQALARLENPSA